MVFPWIPYQEEIDGADMGDLEFIQEKVDEGNFFQVSGDINTLNDVISYTPAVGKTAYMIEAKITFNTITSASSAANSSSSNVNQVIAELKINSITKSKTIIGVASAATGISASGSGSGFGINPNGYLNVKGLSLVGDGIASIEIENVLDSGSAFAEFSGYLV